MITFTPWLLSLLDSFHPAVSLAVLLKGSVLLLAAGLVAGRLRVASQRHLIWCLALAAQLVLLLLAVLGPALPVAMPAWPGVDRLLEPRPAVVAPATEHSFAPVVGGGAEPTPAARSAVPPPQEGVVREAVWLVIAAVWTAGAFLLLASLLGATLRRGRLVRQSAPATGARWQRLLEQSACQLGLTRPPDLLLGPCDAVPMTWGTLRPVVLLPGSAADWPEARCHEVLLHELSHVRRRDHLSLRMAQLVRALHWYNPLVWWAARRLRAESEQACDDLVLSAGVRPSRYAGHLLMAGLALRATSTAARLSAAALGIAHTSLLAERIANILDEARTRTPLNRWRLLTAVLATAAVVFPLAAAVPAPPTPPDTPAPSRAPTPTAVRRPLPAVSPQVRTPPFAAAEPEISTQPPARPAPALSAPGAAAEPDPTAPAAESAADPAIPAAAAVLTWSAAPFEAIPASNLTADAVRATVPRTPDPPALSPYDAGPTSGYEATDAVDEENLQPVVAVPKGRRTYVLVENDLPVAELTLGRWKPRAELTVGETTYELYREGGRRGEFRLARHGSILARAEKPSVFVRAYELRYGASTYSLRRPSILKRRFVLSRGEQDLGAIEPELWHSRRARLALSEDWPLEIQVFAFWLVQVSWQQDQDTAGFVGTR